MRGERQEDTEERKEAQGPEEADDNQTTGRQQADKMQTGRREADSRQTIGRTHTDYR